MHADASSSGDHGMPHGHSIGKDKDSYRGTLEDAVLHNANQVRGSMGGPRAFERGSVALDLGCLGTGERQAFTAA